LGGGWNASASRFESLNNPTFDPPNVRHYLYMSPTGSWFEDYRPTHMRIEHSFPASATQFSLNVYGRDVGEWPEAVTLYGTSVHASGASGYEFLLSGGQPYFGDIKELAMYCRDLEVGPRWITKIEFKG